MNTAYFQQKLLSLQSYMMSFAMTLTADREDAMDLTQETSLRVLDNLEKYTDNRNFKGWVLTVMRNIFINNYRRVLRSQTVVEQDIDLYHLEATTESSIETPESACRLQEIEGYRRAERRAACAFHYVRQWLSLQRDCGCAGHPLGDGQESHLLCPSGAQDEDRRRLNQ